MGARRPGVHVESRPCGGALLFIGRGTSITAISLFIPLHSETTIINRSEEGNYVFGAVRPRCESFQKATSEEPLVERVLLPSSATIVITAAAVSFRSSTLFSRFRLRFADRSVIAWILNGCRREHWMGRRILGLRGCAFAFYFIFFCCTRARRSRGCVGISGANAGTRVRVQLVGTFGQSVFIYILISSYIVPRPFAVVPPPRN